MSALVRTKSKGDAAGNIKEALPARLGKSASVHSLAGRNPTISLSDGHELLTSYVGPEDLRVALEKDQAQPLSLASADFDEDGVPDLVSGYAYSGRGIVTVHRGNVDSIYPNAPEAQQRRANGTFTNAPFLSPALAIETEVAPDFIGAGDFDGDSHWDVVTGSRDSDALYLLAGDGHGGFYAPQTIELPGVLTALVTGEINRADGLTDVVVGVSTKDGPRLLVFEDPNGALKATPEVLPMPDRVSALALGQLDNGYEMDLAVAAGERLVLIHGRDRKLSLDNAQQEKVLPAQIEGRAIGAPIHALAIGDFKAIHTNALALLTANGEVSVLSPAWRELAKQPSSVRLAAWSKHTVASDIRPPATQLVRVKVSSSPGDDLLVMDAGAQQLQLLTRVMSDSTTTQATLVTNTASVALLSMRLNGDALTDLVALQKGQSSPSVLHTEASQTFTVNTTSDSDDGVCDAAHCSLREAINAANTNAGVDTVNFNIPGGGVQTIAPNFALPHVTEAVTIDGTMQPGFAGTPLIELNGASAGAGINGFVIFGGNSRVRGLVINRFSMRGIDLRNTGGNVIEGNFIGTDASGTVDLGNGDDGVGVIGSSDNLIGGTTAAARNVLSGNGDDGVDIFTPGTPPIATGNLVQGNFIGTDITGTVALGNDARGVNLTAQAPGCTIGGTTAGARNIMSGNKKSGIAITGPSDGSVPPTAPGSLVQGNFIGTDVTGIKALANKDDGLQIGDAPNNTIGGTTSAARNVISANDNDRASGSGVGVQGSSAVGNQIQGNFIGTDATGTKAMPNSIYGVSLGGGLGGNVLGGAVAGARNVVSGNRKNGVGVGAFIEGTAGNNIVQGNFIGTDVSGTVALGNGVHGLIVSSSNNTIGGLTPETRNVIANNGRSGGGNGILLQPNSTVSSQARAEDNTVQGNYIGTDVTGMVAMGNSGPGVVIFNSNRNTIGAEASGGRNVISSNNGAGIVLYGGTTADPGPQGAQENKIRGNFIGTNATGTAQLGNNGDGIQITINVGGANNTVGGPQLGMRNIISGNNGNGISIGIRLPPLIGADGKPLSTPGTGGTGITVQNNYVGTDVTGQNCIGNALDGIFVDADSAINTISDNLVTCNGRNGVFIPQNNNPAVRIFLDNNSVFANAALGIDLGNTGITANDLLDTDGGANLQQNFPVLNSIAGAGQLEVANLGPKELESTVTISGTLNSAPNTTFTLHWYFSADVQCLTNQQASRPLVTGKVPNVTTNANGDAQFNFPLDLPGGISNGIVNCTATDPQGNTSEFSACLIVNGATQTPSLQLDASSYSAGESSGSKVVTVARTGNTANASTVTYTTSDSAGLNGCNAFNTGKASSRCDYETSSGTLSFAAGETSKTISIPVIDDSYAEGNENFTITLSNPTGATLGSPNSAPVTIMDNEATTGANPINQPAFFVRLHYIDFLNREPDASGLAFWSDQITSCGTDQACVDLRRINVSAAFYVSIEFQETGYLVYRFYKASYGNIPGLPVPVRFSEFLPDTQQIGQGVIVGQPGADQVLENNKVAFAGDFVIRARFTSAYPTSRTPAQFVDALFANAGVTPSPTDRTAAINEFGSAVNTADTAARGRALRKVAENSILRQQETNRAFVLMQYFGYLRRNPNDPPETNLNFDGYNFWLGKLNQFNGNFVNAEMVKAFIVAGEYKGRFGP